MHISPTHDQDRPVQAQDLAAFKTDIAAMMRDMIKYSLNELRVVPEATPPLPQSQSQSNSKDKEPPLDLENSSEGEISDPELNEGNPELDQLVQRSYGRGATRP